MRSLTLAAVITVMAAGAAVACPYATTASAGKDQILAQGDGPQQSKPLYVPAPAVPEKKS